MTQVHPQVSVVIPTYGREKVLIDTIKQLLLLEYRAQEILIIDQTKHHEDETAASLERLSQDGTITWIRLDKPSIPKAMNHALKIARNEIVLFLDDDIEITGPLVAEHAKEFHNPEVNVVAGQVIQPWELPLSESAEAWQNGEIENPDAFLFNSGKQRWIKRLMAGNFSIRKDVALKSGGFDENFVKVAYRFEAEFSDRLIAAGYPILFQPKANIRHLKIGHGGTRTYGEHLTTIKPSHSVGRYYYLLRSKNSKQRIIKLLCSPFIAIRTRFHLSHPWWIPVTLIAEFSGLLWALLLYIRGPAYINSR